MDLNDAGANGVTPELIEAIASPGRYGAAVKAVLDANANNIWGLRYLHALNATSGLKVPLSGAWGQLPPEHQEDLKKTSGHTMSSLAGKGLLGDGDDDDVGLQLKDLLEAGDQDGAVRFIIANSDSLGSEKANRLLKVLYR
jgi:hypothetical protein